MTVHPPMLACTDLTVHYDNRSALRSVNVAIRGGEVTALLGPNGAGKSTLLKVLSGMISPSHGSATFEGAPLTGPHASITYVPQRSDVDWKFPISVLECTLLGLIRSRSRWAPFSRSDKEAAMAALHNVGMDHLAHAQIDALSGGQQQRVFLARALMNQGKALLLDEPFTGVDVPTQEMLVAILGRLKESGTAIVYATHDLAQAAQTADHAILINGEVIADGPPSFVFTEDNLAKTFGGAIVSIESLRAVAR
ncbi:MAG: metal ABC transporter ATP-binding protein [Thermomicrobiales bacterium]|nr:metal ABC transporter ATP-binding protein [Thermomicrobiales bacterium]